MEGETSKCLQLARHERALFVKVVWENRAASVASRKPEDP
jgi:hypothetical protein